MDGQPGDAAAPPGAGRRSSGVTGTGRKVKDNAADWFNLTIRWNKLNDEGFDAATAIVNLRRSQTEQPMENEAPSAPSSPEQAAALQDECRRLEDVVDKMVAVVTKMERLAASQRAVTELEEFRFGAGGRRSPLFHSWTGRQFEAAAETLLGGYRQELRLKRTVLQEVAHTATSDLCMVYLSCWLHQPFTPDQHRLTLEALLLETGHRPL